MSQKLQTKRHPPSRIGLVGDGFGWATDADKQDMVRILQRLDVKLVKSEWAASDWLFYLNRYKLISQRHPGMTLARKVAVNYFHGNPDLFPKFSTLLENFKRREAFVNKVRVSNDYMRQLLEDGPYRGRVQLIRIPVDAEVFRFHSDTSRKALRARFGIPESALVVGSFQKDGEGWKEGLVPKLEKGPDIFLQTVTELRAIVPELFVLLSGPARGYVVDGLRRIGLPYLHVTSLGASEVPSLYQCLDLYIVASRDEGGPKAVLEAMASGIPIVSTPTGQGADLIISNENGWLSSSFDPLELADLAHTALRANNPGILRAARALAEENSVPRQAAEWTQFFELVT